MNRQRLLFMWWCALLTACGQHTGHPEDAHAHGSHQLEEITRGPHGGRLLKQDDFALELTILESGIAPEFRVWLYDDGKPTPPGNTKVEVALTRLDGQVDAFQFAPAGAALRGNGVVHEPHSFDVVVNATRQGGKPMRWEFSSHEGRTQISQATADAMGVELATAAAHTIDEQLQLSGAVQADPTRIARVRARYPGVVRSVSAGPSSVVARGALLAQVQSNESLQIYSITAPIAGTLVEHRAQVGETTGEEPLFTIMDVSKVWVELDVFQSQLEHIEENQSVALFDLDKVRLAAGRIARIAPVAAHGSQSVRARVVIDNAARNLRPGQFVIAQVTLAQTAVPLAVERSALQRFRNVDVVFERIGETYEVRMLQLGRGDATHVEVLSGLKPNARYVTTNSYLIKADIEKSTAGHDH